MNWMIDLCSILILNSIQGMVFKISMLHRSKVMRIWCLSSLSAVAATGVFTSSAEHHFYP